MRPTILSFNLSDERLSRLRFACMKLGLAVKAVPAEDFARPIAALCGLADGGENIPGEPFSGEMIVFCHMGNAQVSRFLQTAKQMRFAPVALKAILTPTNAEWTPIQLHAELKAEREAVLKGSMAHED